MARKKKTLVRITLRLSLDDKAALDSAALTLDRDPQWVLGKLAHLAVGEIELSRDVRQWLRGDTAWDAGLSGDQIPLVIGETMEPPIKRVPRRKTVAEEPPSLDDILAYQYEKGYHFDAAEFHAFYKANGWVQGHAGKPLLDWKAACVTWEKTWLEKNPERAAVTSDWGAGRPAEAAPDAAPGHNYDEPDVADDHTEPLFPDGE